METQAQVVGMPITYNGVNINQWFIATDVQRGLGTNHSNQLTKIGKTDGQYFQYMTRDTLTIAVTGYIRDDDDNTGITAARRSLAQAIDSDDLEQLIFGDEPDKYYLAITDGQASISETGYNGTVTLSFIVPDGVAHAVNLKTFTGLDADGNLEIQDNGTYPSYPIIEATMKGENGLAAFVSDADAVLQFGNPEELDGETLQKSERGLWEGYDSIPKTAVVNSGFATNYPYYVGDKSRPNKIQGSIAPGIDPAKGSGAMPTFTNGSTGDWGGPSLYEPVKPSSNGATGNFQMRTRFYFATSIQQTGRLEITLQNGSNVAYSCIIRDSTSASNEIYAEFWVQNKKMDTVQLNRKYYTNGMFRQLSISKMGNQITFQIAAVTDILQGNTTKLAKPITKTYNLSYMASVPVDGYGFWYQRYRNTPHVLMDITDAQFVWVNVNYWHDLPNRFSSGDVLTIDVGNRKIFVNGVEDETLQTIGNEWDKFLINPGLTKIQPVCSTWADMFDLTIYLREAFV